MLIRTSKALFSMLKSSRRMAGRTWGTELMARTMRSLFQDADGQSVRWLRREVERAAAYHPALHKASVNTREVAGVPCMMVSPKQGANSQKIVMYYHGGGYVCGSPKSYRAMLAQLAVNSNCLVLAPDYRLAPEHPFPIPQDDCLTVTRAAQNAYPDHTLVLAGDSAGGALAVSTALQLANDAAARPAHALVLISPWVDPTAQGGTMQSNAANDFLIAPFLDKSYAALMQNGELVNPRTHFVDVNLSALPKTLVQSGGGELFFDQIQAFSERALAANVELTHHSYSGQFHDFQLLSALLKDAKHAMREIAEFINSID